ncbi:hypothetical protein [Rhodomicrobium sp.]|uniref:hypothetical protein n=1 Tax=Rhodomicrobium sp. TaxID=2720632 RepID=UPI0039E61B68
MAQFSEDAVHGYLFKTGLTDLVDETAALDEKPVGGEEDFQLWRIIKARALTKLTRLLPLWSAVVTSASEVAISHNFAFRPTGMTREAYVSCLNAIYARNASGVGYQEDVSTLKVNEISNWLVCNPNKSPSDEVLKRDSARSNVNAVARRADDGRSTFRCGRALQTIMRFSSRRPDVRYLYETCPDGSPRESTEPKRHFFA